jgi:hypothetical protein
LPQFVRANHRARFWGLWLLVAASLGVAALTMQQPILGAMLLAWLAIGPFQWLRIAARVLRRGIPARRAAEYALFVLLSNLPHLVGQVWNLGDRALGQSVRLVEHKAGAKT